VFLLQLLDVKAKEHDLVMIVILQDAVADDFKNAGINIRSKHVSDFANRLLPIGCPGLQVAELLESLDELGECVLLRLDIAVDDRYHGFRDVELFLVRRDEEQVFVEPVPIRIHVPNNRACFHLGKILVKLVI
jgi:hypothetical protein